MDAFKAVKSLADLTGENSIFAPGEIMVLRIFDKVKVRVDTTTEFPLDIKCTMIFGEEDLADYDKILMEQEA